LLKRYKILTENVVVASEVIQTEETVPDDEAPADTEEPLSSELDTLAPLMKLLQKLRPILFLKHQAMCHLQKFRYRRTNWINSSGIGVKSIGMEVDTGDHPDYDVKRTVAQLEKENEELRNTLEQVNEQLEKGGKRKKSAWYETLATLTQEERAIMRYIISKRKI